MPHTADQLLNALFEDYVTEHMCEALTRLQTVRPFDYAGAKDAAMPALFADSMRDLAGRSRVLGEMLAYDLYKQRQTATVKLRAAA
jgi:hypothetical protein